MPSVRDKYQPINNTVRSQYDTPVVPSFVPQSPMVTPEGSSAALQPGESPFKNFGQRFLANLNPLNNPTLPGGGELQNPVGAGLKGAGETGKTLVRAPLTASVGNLAAPFVGNRPIDVPGIGNINPRAETPASLTGEALNFGMTAINLLNPTSSVTAAAGRGAVQGAGSAMEKGETSPLNIAWSGLSSGALAGGLQYGLNKVLGSPDKIKKQQQRTTLPEAEAERLANRPGIKDQYDDLLERAKEAARDPDNKDGAVKTVADKANEGIRKLQEIANKKGAEIGNIKGNAITNKSGNLIPIKDLRKDFLSDLSKKGVYVDKTGNLNFTKSTMSGSTGDQAVLKQIWADIAKKGDIDEKTALILRENLQNQLYQGGRQGTVSASTSIANKFTKGLTDKVHELNPALKDLDEIYSDLAKATQGTGKSVNANNPILGQENVGANMYNLLRKSLGRGNTSNVAIVKKLQEYGQKYGIPELSDLVSMRRIAQMADDAVGLDQIQAPTSLVGRTLVVGKELIKGNAGKAAAEGAAGLQDVAKKSATANANALIKSLAGQAKRAQVLGENYQPIIQPLANALRGGTATAMAVPSKPKVKPSPVKAIKKTVESVKSSKIGQIGSWFKK
jgi:hypothetical protein